MWSKQKIASFGTGPKKTTEHYAYIAVQASHVDLGFYCGSSLPVKQGPECTLPNQRFWIGCEEVHSDPVPLYLRLQLTLGVMSHPDHGFVPILFEYPRAPDTRRS